MDQVFADGLFTDEVVLITGGGSGIGLVGATEMGQLGAKIAICGRRPQPLQEAVAELESKGIEAFAAPCDIREPEAISAYVDAVVARFGKIDVLINNAGGQFPTTAEALSPKGFAAVIRNNLIGTWAMTHAVATKAMIPQKRGRIITDFLIGAHAVQQAARLVTRDRGFYRRYFSTLKVVEKLDDLGDLRLEGAGPEA